MNSNNPYDEFTFSIENKEYVIKEKSEQTKNKTKNNFLNGPSLGIGGVITAVCVLGMFSVLNLDSDFEEPLVEKQLIKEPQYDVSPNVLLKNTSPVLGNPNAPITLVEFGDYQCHFCNVHFHNTEHKILEKYVATGIVKILFKDYTIIGPDSISAAHAAHCAGDQDKYWEYHGMLYSNWSGENNGWASSENLYQFAFNISLDLNLFEACMVSERHISTIQKSNADAQTLGITGTPAFFVIGDDNVVEKISGAQPFETFEGVFNHILEK